MEQIATVASRIYGAEYLCSRDGKGTVAAPLAAGQGGNAEALLQQAREIFQRLGAAEASDLAPN